MRGGPITTGWLCALSEELTRWAAAAMTSLWSLGSGGCVIEPLRELPALPGRRVVGDNAPCNELDRPRLGPPILSSDFLSISCCGDMGPLEGDAGTERLPSSRT